MTDATRLARQIERRARRSPAMIDSSSLRVSHRDAQIDDGGAQTARDPPTPGSNQQLNPSWTSVMLSIATSPPPERGISVPKMNSAIWRSWEGFRRIDGAEALHGQEAIGRVGRRVVLGEPIDREAVVACRVFGLERDLIARTRGDRVFHRRDLRQPGFRRRGPRPPTGRCRHKVPPGSPGVPARALAVAVENEGVVLS